MYHSQRFFAKGSEMVFAISRKLIAAFGVMAVAASASTPPAKPRTQQGALALEFLRRLESGQAASAHSMLASSVAVVYAAGRLQTLAGKSRLAPGMVRQIRSERTIPPGEAYANQLAAKLGAGSRNRPSYIVCMADIPKTGYGRVTYVAVVLVAGGKSGWQVSDFRYQSEPDRNCKA
jgi:hypothetical protein